MNQNLNYKRNHIYNKNKNNFDWNDTNEFSKDNYLIDNKQRNILYLGNPNNRNNFQGNVISNNHNTRMTNFKPNKNNFDLSEGRNNNGFYRSYERPNNLNSNLNNRNNISSPFKKADDILFIPCINCNQLIKVDQIEQHSEVCISYSDNIENANKDYFKTSLKSQNVNGGTISNLNKFTVKSDQIFPGNNLNTNNCFQAETSNHTGKLDFSNINSFANSKSKKLHSHDFANQKNLNLMNSNINFNLETNMDKTDEFNKARLSNYSNNLVINSNSFFKNEGAAGFSSNLNSFLDLISENDISNSIRNVKNKNTTDGLIYRNRVINEKLNKILCQINEVDFRMNIIPSEEHYIFSIENYLLDSIKWGNIDTQTIENNLEKINKNYVNTEALMISFNGSINIHIILKKVKDLLQEKVKIMRLFYKTNDYNINSLEKSKSRIGKSDIEALENEIRKKKELCDKINFEKELAEIKVKNLKKSVIHTNRKTADNMFETPSQEPRLTYQNKGSNKNILDNNVKKNTATFKSDFEFNENVQNNKDLLNKESNEPIHHISFNKPIESLDKDEGENKENLDCNSHGSKAEQIKIANTIKNNFSQSSNSREISVITNKTGPQSESELRNMKDSKTNENDLEKKNEERKNNLSKIKANIDFNKEGNPRTNLKKSKKSEDPIQKELFGSFNIKKEKEMKIKQSENEINISKIERADNINHNFKLSKDIEKENLDTNISETDLNKKNVDDYYNSDNVRYSKKLVNSNKNRMEPENSNKFKKDQIKNSCEKQIKKEKGKNGSKSSFEAEFLLEDPEYMKEMKELYKLFKKNLLKIKFEKFPNNENCNRKHLNLQYPEREIFNNLIKQNIPEEEWYEFIYDEILNYNCLQTIKSEDNQHHQIKSKQKKSKLDDSII